MDPGHCAAGDPTAGDPAGGDPTAGDPAGGDPAAGDPAGGDPTAGDPAGGDPTAGDPAGGDPAAGDPTGGDPAAGLDVRVFLQTLQTLWSSRELRQLNQEAWRGFAVLEDPRAGLLDLLEGSRAWQRKGPTLEAWVTHELNRWLQAQPPPETPQSSPAWEQLQARAVRVLAGSPPSLLEPLVSIFQLQDAERSTLLGHVHRLHREGKFKEAVMLGTELRLQPELDVEKDKGNLVERYVAGFPDLQRRLLALMDSWCRPGFDIRQVARAWRQ